MSLLYQKCWNQLAQNVQFLQKRTKLATFLFTSVTYQCQRLPGINGSSYLLISLFHYINHYIGFSAYLWHPKSNCGILPLIKVKWYQWLVLFDCFDLGFQVSNRNPVIEYRPDPSCMSYMEAHAEMPWENNSQVPIPRAQRVADRVHLRLTDWATREGFNNCRTMVYGRKFQTCQKLNP